MQNGLSETHTFVSEWRKPFIVLSFLTFCWMMGSKHSGLLTLFSKTSWFPFLAFLFDPGPKQFEVVYFFGSWDQNTVVSLNGFSKHRCLPSWCFFHRGANPGTRQLFHRFHIKPIGSYDFKCVLQYSFASDHESHKFYNAFDFFGWIMWSKHRGLPTWVSKTSLSLFLAFFGCGAKSGTRQLFHHFCVKTHWCLMIVICFHSMAPMKLTLLLQNDESH